MKKFFIMLFLMMAAFVALVFTAPLFLDDAAFEKRFVENFETVTGRKVAVDGEFIIKIFPAPSLDVQKVRIIASEGAKDEDLLYVERLKAELDLTTFLFGGVQVTRAELVNPVINLEIMQSGQVSWLMDFFKAPDMQLTGDAYVDRGISLKSVGVENGTLNFADSISGFNSSITGIYGDFVADTLRGPYRFDGNFALGDESASLAVSLDRLQEQNPSEFNVMIARGEAESRLSVSGSLLSENNRFNMSGNVALDIGKPEILFKSLFKTNNPIKDIADNMAANMSFAVADGKIKITDFVFKKGDASAVGDAVLILAANGENADEKRLSASLIANAFDLEQAIEIVKAINMSEDRFLPKSAELAFKSDVMTYKGQDIRNLAFKLDMKKDAITVTDIVAQMPGDSSVKADLSFANNGANDGAKVITSGKVDFEAQNFGDVVKWLAVPLLKDASSDALLTARMTADINGVGSVVSFVNTNLRVGSVALSGSIGSDLASPRDNVVLDVRVSDVDLEKYIPKPIKSESKAEGGTLEELQGLIYDTAARLGVLNTFDVSGKIDLSRLSFGARQIGRIISDISLKNGVLSVGELKATNLAGGTLGLKGSVSGLGTESPKFANINYTARLVNMASFLNNMGIDKWFDTSKISNMQTEGKINGEAKNVSFKASFETAGVTLNTDGWLFLPFGKEPTARFQFGMAHTNAQNFVKLLVVPYELPAQFSGAISVKGDASVKTGMAVIRDFDFVLGKEKALGTVSLANEKYALNLVSNTITTMEYYGGENKGTGRQTFGQFLAAIAKNNDVNIAWKIDRIITESDIFNDANIGIKIAKGVGNVDFKATLGKGSVRLGAGVMFEGSVPVFTGNVVIEKMSFNEIFPAFSMVNVSANNADFKAGFKCFGRSIKEIKNSLTANGQFVLENGEINAVGLNRAYVYLQDVAGVDENSHTAFMNVFKTTDASYIKATGGFKVVGDKVAVSDTVINYMPDENAKLSANYDIGDKNLTAKMVVDFSKSGLPSYNVVISGGLDNLMYNFDAKEVVKSVSDKKKMQEELIIKQQAEARAEDEQKSKESEARRNTFNTKLNDLKMSVAKAYKQAADAGKMVSVAAGMESIIVNTKSVAEKMVAEFASLVDVANKDVIADEDIAAVDKMAARLKDTLRQIEQNYGQVVMASAKKLTKDYADNVAKYAKYAKDMDKANPYLPAVSAAAKIVDDANYDAQMALRIVNETKIYKDAEDAVSRAKRAYDKSKAAVDSIVKATGYTEGL